mmetsp:Transcript_36669/g.117634  ORF Transcript_36669/g.117634 Transcript_36669/m.117634 type:complete len:433 (-) Transcript_36669:225-1523(-)
MEFQRRIFVLNWSRLLYDMGKPDECYEVLKKELGAPLTPADAEDATTADMIALAAASKKKKSPPGGAGSFVAALKKGKKPTKEEVAARTLQAAAEDSLLWKKSPRLALYAAQANVESGDFAKAAEALAEVSTAGTASTRACLLEAAGDDEGAKRALDALDYGGTSARDRQNRLLLAGHWLRLGEFEKGAAVLENCPTSSERLESLVKALLYTFYDYDLAKATLDALPPPLTKKDDDDENDREEETQLDDEAAEALLAKPPPRPTWATTARYRSIAEKDKRDAELLLSQEDDDETNKKKPTKSKAAVQRRRDRKRELHLEKLAARGDYDPTNPPKPDPERWLPKKLRSYNKRLANKNKKQWQQKMSGAQGVDATINQKEIAKLDVAARTQKQQATDDDADGTAVGAPLLKKLPPPAPKLPNGAARKNRKKRGG